MLNKKGFTIAEVLVSFSLITLILLSIIGSTVFYRDKLKTEEVKSQLLDFKNGITKIIYDDIIKNKAIRVETCLGESDCVNIIGEDGTIHNLRIYEVKNSSGSEKRGAYLMYDGVKYFLPDSDLSGEDKDHNIIRTCDFTNGIRFTFYKDMYTIKISFSHRDYDIHRDIMITVMGGKGEYSYDLPGVPTLTLADTNINMALGGPGKSTTYTYDGDGIVRCESSDPLKVSCSVNTMTKTITVTPVDLGTNIEVRISASTTVNSFAPEPKSIIVNVKKKSLPIAVAKDVVNLTYGINGNNQYTYDCDGEVSCASSDTSKVKCDVNQDAKTILLTPVDITSNSVSVAVSAAETTACISPGSTAFNVNVGKRPCEAPTNVMVSPEGIVTWTPSSDCSTAQHQIRVNESSWADAASGVNYKSNLITSAGEKKVDVRVVPTDSHYSPSSVGTKTINVYSVSLTKGDGVASVTGNGNYIAGSTATINATMEDHYIWSKWTGMIDTTTQNYSTTVNDNLSATANTVYLCGSTTDTLTCGNCSQTYACQGGKKNCTHKYYSTVSGYTDHLCSEGSTYQESCGKSCSWFQMDHYPNGNYYCYRAQSCPRKCAAESGIWSCSPRSDSDYSNPGGLYREDGIYCWCVRK